MKDYAKKLMDTAILAGQIMLECNAETYRVEETMNYILSTSNFETCEAFAMATGVFATLDDKCIDSLTEIRRVSKRETNLNRIYKVNNISRRLVLNQISLDEAYDKLQEIEASEYSPLMQRLSVLVMCGGYSALYGGGLLEMLVASLVAIVLLFVTKLDAKLSMGNFITNVLSLIPMVLLIVLVKNTLLPNLNSEAVIVGAMMPLVPGTAITNAIRDTLRGDYNSGVARALEAFVTALSVALGVAIAMILAGGAELL